MKTCQRCGNYILYDDSTTVCPNCGNTLTAWKTRDMGVTDSDTISPVTNTRKNKNEPDASNEEAFEVIDGKNHIINGRITEISTQTRVHSRLKKLVNVIFHGEPYQLGHTSHETVIRVTENCLHRFSSRSRDIFFYGDVEGRFVVGDNIRTVATEIHDRLVVREMINKTTGSNIRPAAQLSSGSVAVLAGVLLAVFALLLWLLLSGRLFQMLGVAIGGAFGILVSLFAAVAPVLLAVWIIRAMLR